MGDQQQAGGKRLLQFAHQLEDLRLNSDVEGRGRLIGNQHLWLAQHCHGDHHPLAHTAGKLVRILLQALLHMTDFDRVQHRADRLRRSRRPSTSWRCSVSSSCWPTVISGLSEVIGS